MARNRQKHETRVSVEMPQHMAKEVNKVRSIIRRSHEAEVKIADANSFFKKMSQPVESRAFRFIEDLKNSTTEMLDTTGVSRIIEVNPDGGWRWRTIKNSDELRAAIRETEKNASNYMKLKEASYKKMLGREDSFGFGGDDMPLTSQQGAFPSRQEYTPLIGTPFFKQLYLQDMWEQHSKCFWYSNYSGIAKMIVDMTRNFVMGKGFKVQFKDEKAQDAWDRYEDRTHIQERSREWCDDLTKFGENMLLKVPTPKGIIHRAFDPSTIWEIVTDPELITDEGIKYYHQQYNTQYQLYTTKDAPSSKYIIKQLPPELVLHTKVNITPYEKRGRSDLLAALLYFKYYEDYTIASLIRAKNEAAFIWDVTIKGSDEDVQAYISQTESIVDVPPGSENVHNEAITRTPLNPTFNKKSSDEIAQNILSYVAMAVSIPVNYFGTFGTGGYTKAGALVATEPVAKKMIERQLKMEFMIRRIVKDVLIDAGLDPKTEFEVTFPEILEEDRSTKIQDIVVARDSEVISKRTAANMIAKELKITSYDYEKEQAEISADKASSQPFDDSTDDLTDGTDDAQTKPRAFDRASVKKQGLQV